MMVLDCWSGKASFINMSTGALGNCDGLFSLFSDYLQDQTVYPLIKKNERQINQKCVLSSTFGLCSFWSELANKNLCELHKVPKIYGTVLTKGPAAARKMTRGIICIHSSKSQNI